MKTMVASVIAAVGASACCLGPVVFSLAGAGALGAASVRLEPWRPFMLALTGVLLAGAFYNVYRRPADTAACDANGVCPPDRNRRAKQLLWVATAIVVLLAAFPYYVGWFI
jgi:mercuric ion transport protein